MATAIQRSRRSHLWRVDDPRRLTQACSDVLRDTRGAQAVGAENNRHAVAASTRRTMIAQLG
jgi:hypothetical protein